MPWAAIASALWLGIMTSISPCPLASNIAAISFIARKVDRVSYMLMSGLLYTAGRTAAYIALGAAIMGGLMRGGAISLFLQEHMNRILGPVLILVGMLLLGMLGFAGSLSLAGAGVQQRASKGGVWWAFLVGVLFALSFCPVSAGLFFGGLVPLSATHGSRIVLPALYGVGTALPVLVFAFIMAFASHLVGRAFNVLTHVELWVRRVTGTVFVLVGLYYSVRHIYAV